MSKMSKLVMGNMLWRKCIALGYRINLFIIECNNLM